EPRNLRGGAGERIFQVRHEHATLQIEYSNGRFAGNSPDKAAVTGRISRIIQRANESRLAIQQFEHFLLVPEMIAGSDHIDAGGKNLGGSVECDARAAGGIFAVGNNEIEVVLLAQFRHGFGHGAATWLAHDVANEKNLHCGSVGGAGWNEKAEAS